MFFFPRPAVVVFFFDKDGGTPISLEADVDEYVTFCKGGNY